MINKYRNACLLDKFLVMPAGLRDFTIAPNDKPEEDEINNLYRRIISTSNVIGQHGNKNDVATMDSTRYSLQLAINTLYAYIISLLDGKHKLIQAWWTSRKIFRSTRNVITSNVPRTNKLFDELTVGPNDTVVGLYQSMMAIFPVAVNLIRGIASEIFTGPNTPANLINKKTFERETVTIDPVHYDEWMTQEGLEQTFGRFESEPLRQESIEMENHYLALIYNDGKRVKICHGVQDLPEGFDKKYLTPMTYAEFFYLAIFQRMKEIPVFVTRYPITGYGSIYPSFVYLKTTTRSQSLTLLDEQWRETEVKANEFPVKGVPFVNSMSPSIVNLSRLTADFDGDTCSLTPVMSEEGIDEIRTLLNSKNYYVGVDGNVVFSSENDISKLVFAEMTN